jgi:DNA-binding NarL/FixJ family response regulator
MAKQITTQITNTEKFILEKKAQGMKREIIAEFLKIAPRYVEKHEASLMNKLGAVNMYNAIYIAMKLKILK